MASIFESVRPWTTIEKSLLFFPQTTRAGAEVVFLPVRSLVRIPIQGPVSAGATAGDTMSQRNSTPFDVYNGQLRSFSYHFTCC